MSVEESKKLHEIENILAYEGRMPWERTRSSTE